MKQIYLNMPKKYQILPLKVVIREKYRYWSFAKVYPWNFTNFLAREIFSTQKFLPLKCFDNLYRHPQIV